MTSDIKPSKHLDKLFRDALLDEVNKAIKISCENRITNTMIKHGDREIKTELSEENHINLFNDAEDELPFGFFNDVSTLKSYPGNKKSSVPNFVAPVVLLASSVDLDFEKIDLKQTSDENQVAFDASKLAGPWLTDPSLGKVTSSLVSPPPEWEAPNTSPYSDSTKPASRKRPAMSPLTHREQQFCEKSVQCSLSERQEIERLKAEIAVLRESAKYQFALQIDSTDSRSLYYTGLDKEGRGHMWKFLTDGEDDETLSIQAGQILLGANKMSKSVADLDMPAKIQFMLTLVKLWKNFQYEDISVRFACQQQKHASQIFKTWIHIIHTKFLEIRDQLFIRHDDLNPPLPAEWTNNPYTSVQGRCLIDTLEFKFESAKNSQFKTSSNASSSICKALVALTPAGSVAFVSNCYDAKLSDRDVVQYSGFLDHLVPSDRVVAGREWGIEDLLANRGAFFVGPGPDPNSSQARAVHHVMKAFNKFRAKLDKFRYLSAGTIPHASVPNLSQVVAVCCYMTSFFPDSPVRIQPPPPLMDTAMDATAVEQHLVETVAVTTQAAASVPTPPTTAQLPQLQAISLEQYGRFVLEDFANHPQLD